MEYTGKEAAVIYSKIYHSHINTDCSITITNGVVEIFKSKEKRYPNRDEWAKFLRELRNLDGKNKVYSSGGPLERIIHA